MFPFKVYVGLLIFTIIYMFHPVQCIMFNLNPLQRKCLREELKQNVLITGEYEVTEHPGQHVKFVVSWLCI